MCLKWTDDPTCGRVRPKPILAAAGSSPSLDSGRWPRPSLLLPPFKELDSSLISENPTNRLERHHHANPKNLTSTFSSFPLCRYMCKRAQFPQTAEDLGARCRRRDCVVP